MSSLNMIEILPKIILFLIVLFVFISEFSTANFSDLWNLVPFFGKDSYIRVLG